jgi:hypothetical protein
MACLVERHDGLKSRDMDALEAFPHQRYDRLAVIVLEP